MAPSASLPPQPTAARPSGSGNGRLCLAPLRRQRLFRRLRRGFVWRFAWVGFGLLPRSSPAPGRQKEPASRARALLAVAGQAATPQSVGGKPSQLAGLRFVARAPLNCVEADALQFWLFRSRAVKIKPSQQNGKAQAPCQRGFSGGSPWARGSRPGARAVSPAPTFAPGGYFRNVVGAKFPTLD